MLNRSAVVVKPRQPFLDWLHKVDPTSRSITLGELEQDPTIYLIPECETAGDVRKALRKLCSEIFVERLAAWWTDEETWPPDRSFAAFCRWFAWQHHSMLIDLSNKPLIDDGD
jgi:hypothetical protein